MISKACKYGIRAAIFVASKKKEGLKFNIKQIARDALMNAFQKTSIRQLAEQVKDGGFYINNLNLMSDKA